MTDDANSWFKDLWGGHDEIARTFDGLTPYHYFKENEIVLSCEEFEVTKMAVMEEGTNENQGMTSYEYFIVGDGDVTTVGKSGDPMGYFPEVGETDNLIFKTVGGVDDITKMNGVQYFYIE